MAKPGKLIFMGILMAIIKFATNILVPYLTFKYISTIQVMGIPIGLTNEQFQIIIYWITALGLIQVAIAFAKGASPKRSPQKAIWTIFELGIYCLYLWCYKFSGAASLTLTFQYGAVTYDLAVMLRMWLGLVILKLFLAIWDLIDGSVYYYKKRKEMRNLNVTNVEGGAFNG
ncbi:MAG: hypothetical protein ACTSRZ_13800 [Promethearchaeota archaeon]